MQFVQHYAVAYPRISTKALFAGAACTCSSTGSAVCAPCRLKEYVEANGILPGQPLWGQVSAAVSLQSLQRALLLIGLVQAKSFTWKCVRAGRATAMALTPGMRLSTLMEAGEWRSSAVFKYVRPEDADMQCFIAQALDASDGEPESC